MVPYSSLLVGLRSVKQAAFFMLAGEPDQKHQGCCFPFDKRQQSKYMDAVRLMTCISKTCWLVIEATTQCRVHIEIAVGRQTYKTDWLTEGV